MDFTFDDSRMEALDILVVPALGADSRARVIDALMRPDIANWHARLRDWAEQGRLLAAACTGTLLLAESAILKD
ncbi:hypothetical protein [Nocardia sp. NPDC051981]|uniref:hypothetical protein n=1 Tax=Nocardia sp. NPDC051981 TaxID=3155417 RepID=UPI0034416DE6